MFVHMLLGLLRGGEPHHGYQLMSESNVAQCGARRIPHERRGFPRGLRHLSSNSSDR